MTTHGLYGVTMLSKLAQSQAQMELCFDVPEQGGNGVSIATILGSEIDYETPFSDVFDEKNWQSHIGVEGWSQMLNGDPVLLGGMLSCPSNPSRPGRGGRLLGNFQDGTHFVLTRP